MAAPRPSSAGFQAKPAPRAPLVLLDGDLPGLVALASACEAVAIDPRAGRPAEGDPAESAAAPRVSAMLDFSAPDPDNGRLRAARAQAERFGAHWVSERGGGAPPAREHGPARTATLLHALHEAARLGSCSVVWPIWQGRLSDGGVASLDAVATEMDRAELATRLGGLDLSGDAGAGGLYIETPYADLDDASIADLAVDLDVPVETAWWASGGTGEAARAAWTGALRAAGWRGIPAGA